MTLYGAAKAPGDPLREAGTTVAALTDNSGGTAAEIILVVTNTAALTNSTGGTPNDILAAATNTVAITDSSGGTAGDEVKDVPDGGSGVSGGGWSSSGVRDAAIVIMNDNFKDLMKSHIAQRLWNISVLNSVATLADEMIVQATANTSITNAIASLAEKVSDLITHMNDGR